MITLSIDVNKIDKDRLFKGKKGTYLDLVLIETPDNKFGNDYLVRQSCKKEEDPRQIPILGNAKNRSKLSVEDKDEVPF